MSRTRWSYETPPALTELVAAMTPNTPLLEHVERTEITPGRQYCPPLPTSREANVDRRAETDRTDRPQPPAEIDLILSRLRYIASGVREHETNVQKHADGLLGTEPATPSTAKAEAGQASGRLGEVRSVIFELELGLEDLARQVRRLDLI